MKKYFELAEKIAERFTPEIMCQILGGASEKEISKLMLEYGIE